MIRANVSIAWKRRDGFVPVLPRVPANFHRAMMV